jgi:hypothetical protein
VTAAELDRLTGTWLAARYSFGVAGVMLLDFDTTKRQIWMILKLVEILPGQRAQIGDLSFW